MLDHQTLFVAGVVERLIELSGDWRLFWQIGASKKKYRQYNE
jgi:hypothetical protein